MALSASQIKRALRKVEAESATGGTGDLAIKAVIVALPLIVLTGLGMLLLTGDSLWYWVMAVPLAVLMAG